MKILPLAVLAGSALSAQATSVAVPADAPATVLLITSAELAPSWVPFAEWKTRHGKATKIVTVAAIDTGYEGATIQDKIRHCVRQHIEERGTRWVVLGGDGSAKGPSVVPGGPTTVHAQERKGIPTDIVYLSPTSWDADGDGILGEWQDDRDAITYPDGSVGLGRIPVRTAEQVAAFTDKVMDYDARYPTDGFGQRMVYTCTDRPAYAKVRRSWDDHVSKAWGGTVERFFNDETPWDGDVPGSHDLSPDNVVAMLNERRVGKLHIHGHGMLPFWVLEGGTLTAEHVQRLDHAGAYPLITTVSCFTGEYDHPDDPSIVESMLRQPHGGSVAIVAPVRTGKPHLHERADFARMMRDGKLDGTTMTMTRYWEKGIGEGMTTGEALMAAKGAMLDDALRTAGYHLCICELNLLGDPTLDFRGGALAQPELRIPTDIAVGTRGIAIATGVAGATVCLWQGETLYVTAQADDDGVATLDCTFDTAGAVSVGVSGRDVNCATTTFQVAAAGANRRS